MLETPWPLPKHRYLPHRSPWALKIAARACWEAAKTLKITVQACLEATEALKIAAQACSKAAKAPQNRCSLKPASRLQWRSKLAVEHHCSKSLFEDAGLCDALPCSPLLLLYLPPCMDMHG